MPALMGILADRYVPAQKLLSACHIIAAAFMIAAGYYGMTTGSEAQFATLFTLYPAAWRSTCLPSRSPTPLPTADSRVPDSTP